MLTSPQLRSYLCTFALSVCAFICTTTVAATPSFAAVQSASGPQSVFFAFWTTENGFASTLQLNNACESELTVQPTVYTFSGQALQLATLTLPAKSQLAANLALLIQAKGQSATFKKGNLVLTYTAPSTAYVGAQLNVANAASSISYDVPSEMPGAFASSTLDGVWWQRGTTSSFNLALSNTTAASVTVTTTYSATGSMTAPLTQSTTLQAHQTQLVSLNALALPYAQVSTGAGQVKVGAIHIAHTAAPGAVVAFGMLSTAANGFSSSVKFADQSTRATATLGAAHLVLGAPDILGFPNGTSFTALALLANTSTQVADITPVVTISDARVGGTFKTVTLPVRHLQPQQAAVVDVKAELVAAGYVGPYYYPALTLNATGTPGTLVAHLTSVDASGTHVFDVPAKDPGVSMNRYGGSYPWRIDAGYRSVLHLRNMTAEDTEVTIQLDFAGGGFTAPVVRIPAEQEIAIDLTKVRDTQEIDSIDRVIPLAVTNGRATWLEHEEQAVIGRMEVYSVAAGVASSYSCQGPICCPPDTFASVIQASTATAKLEDTVYLKLLETRIVQCSGPNPDQEHVVGPYGPFNITERTTWTAEPSYRVEMTELSPTKRQVYCVGAGPVTITAHYTARLWIPTGPATCVITRFQQTATFDLSIAPILVGDSTCIRGTTASFTLEGGETPIEAAAGWRFVSIGAGHTDVVRTQAPQSLTWSGVMVQAGRVEATVQIDGVPFTATKLVAIAPRPGWAFAPVEAIQETDPNAYDATLGPNDDKFSFVGEPFVTCGTNNTCLGRGLWNSFGYIPEPIAGSGAINDGGPNHRYKYWVACTDTLKALHWSSHPDVYNTNSALYGAQCGNYNPSTMTGFIRGDQMRINNARHEAGDVHSHYRAYIDALANLQNNAGYIAETQVAGPEKSYSEFASEMKAQLSAAQARVEAAFRVEPEGSEFLCTSSAPCTKQGNLNLHTPNSGGYVPCP